ncbi:MAG: Crp/Fnr family transcriptional regulator [Rhodospirillales bacterium]|nr:Crp/Fnr family transcriptional regulator [Rhodospirillales bacterium]
MPRTDLQTRHNALSASPVFQALGAAERDIVLRHATERRFARGATIFQKDERGSALMAVLRGRVRISTVSPAGRELTLNVIDAGGIFGEIALLDGEPRSADATALEETLLLVVERRHFAPLIAANPDLAARLLRILCQRLRRTSRTLEEVALLDLPERLARTLLQLSEEYGQRVGEGVRLDIRLSQRELSALVGASRESVNKQLALWRASGVVALERGRIVLRRPELMARAG